MNRLEQILYAPALRMKAGELNGVRELAQDVAAYVVPRFIVPPLEERNESQAGLFPPGVIPDVGGVLAKFWSNRRAFVDLSYLIEEVGKDSLENWLPQLFLRARSLKSRAIPMVKLHDFKELDALVYKAAIPNDELLKLAICVSSGELVSDELRINLELVLSNLNLNAKHCAIIADFSDSDFSLPELVAPIISGAMELLQDSGDWHHIIFQGTHYPEVNPAQPGEMVFCPRNEWEAWRQAVKFDPTTAAHMTFGDYAADSAKMAFGSGGGRAIRHYRYATHNSWLIARGEKSGSDKEIMRNVCRKIIASEHFAGASFSTADAYIHDTAHDLDGPGNSAMWRQINTTHHITRVVTDVAKVRGIAISEIPQESIPLQLSLVE